MSNEYIPTDNEKKLLMKFALEGSVHTWSQQDKVAYLACVNKKAGLPFGTIGLLRTEYEDWKTKQKVIKEFPYASRQTTIELAASREISLEQKKEYIAQDEARYTYRATDIRTGRFIEAVGSCSLINSKGNPLDATARSNKIMHAETKAKRRASLEICGLAFLDDTEVDSVEGATRLELKEDAAEAPKGNQPSVPAAPAPVTGTSNSTDTPQAAKAAPVPASTEPPKPVAQAVPTPAIAPATPPAAPVSTFDGPKRYEAHAALFAGDDAAIVNDKPHMDLILAGKAECGWDGATFTKWLFDTFGVTNQNRAEKLTLEVFKKIMGGIDAALTSAGR